MTVRHLALAAAAALVLGLGVYLFLEVRSSPAATAQDDPAPKPPRDDRPKIATTEPGRDETPRNVTTVPDRVVRKHPPPSGSDSEPTPTLPTAPTAPDGSQVDIKIDAVMAEANKAYDRGEFDDAKTIAQKVLAKQPGNIRMLRILVSASCIDGDNDLATKHFADLPPSDREQMRVRCARYGVTFPDPKADGK